MGVTIRMELEGDYEDMETILRGIAIAREWKEIQEAILELLNETFKNTKIEDVEEVEEEPEEQPKEERLPAKEVTPAEKESKIDVATELIINAIPPRRGRRPAIPIRRWLSEIVRTGKINVPARNLRNRDITTLEKWGIVQKVKSEGQGYVVIPAERYRDIVQKVIMGD